MSTVAYRLDSIAVRQGPRRVLDVPSLEIAPGRATVLVGPNGAGKTTLLRLLALLQEPSAGTLAFRGRAVPTNERDRAALRRDVTLVAQFPFLFDRSVRENVAWGLRARGAPAGRIVDESLEGVGLPALASRNARTLSAGEAQRVALARALAIDPPVLLLDEPTASVDRDHVPSVEATITRLRSGGKTVVIATHDLDQAYRLGDVVLSLVDGRISRAPVVNLIHGRVVRTTEAVRLEAARMTIELATDPGVNELTVAIAPEEIVVSSAPLHSSARNTLEGRIVRAVHDERGLLLTADCGQPIVARITDRSWRELGLHLGEPVWLTFKSSAVHRIDPPEAPVTSARSREP